MISPAAGGSIWILPIKASEQATVNYELIETI